MRTITFYAYKGGTGRTLALARAAHFLAEEAEGRRVFVLDLDLEAPGLHFKLLGGPQRDALGPGFVELAHQYVHEGYFSSIEGHFVEVERPGKKGQILLMPAGKALSGDYWQKLTGLNWQELFGKDFGDGVPLFLELKDRIQETCRPDYLLIDARTGVTEVGGAALTLLADDVVCLFSNNPESKWGTREAIRTIARTPRLVSQAAVRVIPVLARFPESDSEEEEQEHTKGLLAYLNEPGKEGGPSPRMEHLFVLHSHRALEVDEQSELGEQPEKGGTLKSDYDKLFEKGLGIKIESLALGRSLEEAQRTQDGETAFLKWSERLDRLLESTEGKREEILDALDGWKVAYTSLSRHQEVVPRLRGILEREGAEPPVRARAAQHLALALARSTLFEQISAELFSTALTPEVDEKTETEAKNKLGWLSELKEEYDAAPHRYWAYENLVLELGRRLEASGDAAGAQGVIRSGLSYFSPWGEEALLPVATLRHALGNLLRRAGNLDIAETELRAAEVEHRRLGSAAPILAQLREDLAAVLDAQNRPDAAEEIRKALREEARKGLARQRAATVPAIRALPPKRTLSARAGTETVSFEVPLRIVTPLLGGAAETREIDSVDVVRGPSVRGHLRFWWRALQRGRLSAGEDENTSAEELFRRERQLWGGAGDATGGRSTVEVRVSVLAEGEVDASDVLPYGRNETQGAYALWPARATTRGTNPQPVAPRRKPGTRFVLGVTCKPGDEGDVRAAVRAWILFGGYGGRTRRGAGSLTVEGRDDVRRLWLPAEPTREALRELFGRDVLGPISGRSRDDMPLLAGAGLRVGGAPTVTPDAPGAWIGALHWLRDFRQKQPQSGTSGVHLASHARDRGDSRPGRSNWPEADKVRQLSPLSGTGAQWAHKPLHNDVPVWPRAGFGLPIVAQFQRMDRTRARYPEPGEPRDFELRWRRNGPDGRVKVFDRLASPLIVKALPLADGRFVPCALWLFRGYPRNGEVMLEPRDSRSAQSAAPFDVLVAPGDQARYTPLDRPASEPAGTRLRNAFFDWLARTNPSLRTVAQ